MTTNAKICDLCAADHEVTVADGQYTTHEGNTFDACEAHLEEVEAHNFTTQTFKSPGDIKL
ncbi:MAG: hypothetical protein V4662_13780 [Verrucomicrobiota bacterium]